MKLEKQLQKELKERYNESLKTIKNFKSINEILGYWYYKNLLTSKQIEKAQHNELTLKEVKNILKNKLQKEQEKTYQKEVKKINNILAQESIKWGECSIDWVRNRTWGNCPKGYYRNGFKWQDYRSITGCGYCKLSTLTANMLNDDINLMAYVYKFIEKHNINKNNIQNKLGYGISIYNGQPYFEGGVGLECHIRILKNMGFDVQHHETRKSDILTFELK